MNEYGHIVICNCWHADGFSWVLL